MTTKTFTVTETEKNIYRVINPQGKLMGRRFYTNPYLANQDANDLNKKFVHKAAN
jgi:phage terminase small subunit